MDLFGLLACVLSLTYVYCCPKCESKDISDDIAQYLIYLTNNTDESLLEHRQTIQHVLLETYDGIHTALSNSDSLIRTAGEMIKKTIERVVTEAPEKVTCLKDTKSAVTRAMSVTGEFLTSCTKELTDDSRINILKALDQEEDDYKQKLEGAMSTLRQCRGSTTKRRAHFLTDKLERTSCALDQWEDVKLLLDLIKRPTSEFLVESFKQSSEFKTRTEDCLKNVGTKILKNINEVTRDIEHCAGINSIEEIE